MAMITITPVGLHLASRSGLVDVPDFVFPVVWLAAVIWMAGEWLAFRRMGRPEAVRFYIVNGVLMLLTCLALLGFGIASIVGDGPFSTMWARLQGDAGRFGVPRVDDDGVFLRAGRRNSPRDARSWRQRGTRAQASHADQPWRFLDRNVVRTARGDRVSRTCQAVLRIGARHAGCLAPYIRRRTASPASGSSPATSAGRSGPEISAHRTPAPDGARESSHFARRD